MIGLLVCPADPTIAFWLLAPIFMIDAFLNAGITIANNGFMIKNSPRENRTMFIAAGTGFAGMVGGVASIAAGAGDRRHRRLVVDVRRHRSTSIFTCCSPSAWCCGWPRAVLATRMREPSSATARVVAGELLVATRVRVQTWQTAIIGRRDTRPAPPTVSLNRPAAKVSHDSEAPTRRAA